MRYYYDVDMLHEQRKALIEGERPCRTILWTKRYKPTYKMLMCFGKSEWSDYPSAVADYRHMVARSAMEERYKGVK